jgi:hypothetical protein
MTALKALILASAATAVFASPAAASVSDGTSNTISVAEAAHAPKPPQQGIIAILIGL